MKIDPVIRRLRARAVLADGPLPADTVFFRAGGAWSSRCTTTRGMAR